MSESSTILSPIERSLLRALGNRAPLSIEQLAQSAFLGLDQTRRGIEWLKFKNLISSDETSSYVFNLSLRGAKAATEGLPERRLVEALRSGKGKLDEILETGSLRKEEINAAIAAAKRNGWIQFTSQNTGNKIELTLSAENRSVEEKLLEKLKQQENLELSQITDWEKEGLKLLKRRPDYIVEKEKKILRISLTDKGRDTFSTLNDDQAEKDRRPMERRITPELIASGRWRNVSLTSLDVEAPAPILFAGRRHPLIDIIEEVKEIFVGLGFTEIDGPIVQSSFWNFDALFTPQDHPARDMQDTFYLSGEQMQINATKSQILKISQAHRRGWGYTWNPKEAERVVLRTHTTPITLKYLANATSENARIFSIGRVYRNEKVSFKHLVEFHQVEGVVTGPKVSLRDLMGLQKEFYLKMGVKKVKFWPTFFPYTEPSLQSMIYNERLGKWVELFGMGIFRPEVTRPLKIKNQVLAWGGGLERIAMLRFGLSDVRELYNNKLGWLRSVPSCQL